MKKTRLFQGNGCSASVRTIRLLLRTFITANVFAPTVSAGVTTQLLMGFLFA